MKIFDLVLIGLIFLSCSHKKDKQYEFVPTGKTKSFILSKKTQNYSNYIRYFKANNDSQYLVMGNKDFNRIEFYDWNTCKLSHIINIIKEGPNGVGSLRGFEIISMDSILVFNSITYNGIFYMIDRNGIIIRKYEIKSLNIEYPFVPIRPNSAMNSSIIIKNDSIVFVPSFVFYNLNNPKDIAKCKLLAMVNLKSGESKIFNMPYPILYNSDGKPVSPLFSFINNDNKWIFAFGCSNDIFVSNELKQLYRVKASSKYIKGNSFLSNTIEDNWNYKKMFASPVYKSFYFDSINNVYYRFVNLGEELNDKDIITPSYYPKNFSVIIFNTSFEVIGETRMPQDKYVLNMSFMSEEGLYISTSNVNSPEYDENCLKFDLFTIKN